MYPTRCNVTQFIYIWKLPYMFRVVLPHIIRSAYNCIYSIWYLSHRYCYLPLSWKSWNRFECVVGGVRHPQHTQKINKLCNVASCSIYSCIGILLVVRPILHISRKKVNSLWFYLWSMVVTALSVVCVYVCTYTHTTIYIFFCCGAATQRRSWPPHSWGF
jgi:hypothetical protein